MNLSSCYAQSLSSGIKTESKNICPTNLRFSYSTWLPYSYINHQGKMKGLDYQIIKEVLNEIGCTFEITECPWIRCIMEIREGKTAILNGVTPTVARKEYSYISKPYRYERSALFALKGFTQKHTISKLSDIKKYNLILTHTRGTFFGDVINNFVMDKLNKNNVYFIDTAEQEYKMLQTKRSDLLIKDVVEAKTNLTKLGIPYEIVKIMNEVGVSFMVGRKNVSVEFMNAFDNAIEKLQESGRLREIKDKFWKKHRGFEN